MDRTTTIERYASGYDDVVAALEGITDDELDRAPTGGWSARWIVHHLADAEATAYVRLARLLADGPAVSGNDEEALARSLWYDRPVATSLALFRAAREASRALLDSMDDGGWARVDGWLNTYAEHPHQHADQIRRARRGEP